MSVDKLTRYFGTKQILAAPMTLGDYNNHQGWDLPADQDGSEEGFLVEYVDGGPPNHPEHNGYISWSPADVFNATYRPTTEMDFSHALQAIKGGYRCARAGWNGENMFVFLVNGSRFQVNRPPLLGIFEEGHEITYRPHIDLCAADNSIGVWQPSMGDVMAEDWMIVPGRAD